MPALYITLGLLIFLLLVMLILSYVCFYFVFYVSKKQREIERNTKYPIPVGEAYHPHREKMISFIRDADELSYREFSMTSHDGLTLCAKYYEFSPDAPIELMLHGYRGSGRRDLSAGIFRAARVGHSAFVVDHRGAGSSEGNVITFGVKERRDALDWLNLIIREFGEDRKIILTGISMGAATVMLTVGEDLPKNVVGALADCGYTSAKDIIKKVICDMHLPANLLYPFVRLGGRIFGGFDVDEADMKKTLPKCRIPIILYHGDNDDFVPYEMSLENYKLIPSRKRLEIIPYAAHGLCYMREPKGYLLALDEFFEPELGRFIEPETVN